MGCFAESLQIKAVFRLLKRDFGGRFYRKDFPVSRKEFPKSLKRRFGREE